MDIKKRPMLFSVEEISELMGLLEDCTCDSKWPYLARMLFENYSKNEDDYLVVDTIEDQIDDLEKCNCGSAWPGMVHILHYYSKKGGYYNA